MEETQTLTALLIIASLNDLINIVSGSGCHDMKKTECQKCMRSEHSPVGRRIVPTSFGRIPTL